MKNRIVSLFLAAAIMASSGISVLAMESPGVPTDIDDDPNREAIETIAELGGLEGLLDANGAFHPGDICRHGDFAEMMGNLFYEVSIDSGDSTTEAASRRWCMNVCLRTFAYLGHEIIWLGSTCYDPTDDESVTRGEACDIIAYLIDFEPELHDEICGSETQSPQDQLRPQLQTPPQPRPMSEDFIDVPADAYYAKAVAWAVEAGITRGVGAGAFAPEDSCAIEQVLVFLHRANGSPEANYVVSEMSRDRYSYQALSWAMSEGLLLTGGDFEQPCTRVYLVTCLWRLAGSPATAASGQFNDVPADAPYAEAVAWAVRLGITSGTGPETFSPFDTVTRAQAVTFLNRAYAN